MNDKKVSIFEEAGDGAAVICLLDSGANGLMDAMSEDFRVLAIAPAKLAGASHAERASALLAAAKARGVEKFALVAQGEDAAAALHAAAVAGESLEALVLLSPMALDANGFAQDATLADALAQVKAQTLALFGTRDDKSPPTHGGHYKRGLSACHLIYVFDAADTASERLEAVSEVVLDFLHRRDAFLVNAKDGRVHA